jgi:membrane fusion protein, copper/silver efflux system
MNKPLLIGGLAVLAAAGGGVYLAHQGGAAPHRHQLEARNAEDGTLYYTCAMHPEVRQDEPGNCPICGMRLTARKSGGAARPAGEAVVVEIDPRMAQNLGLRTATVKRAEGGRRVSAVGAVRIDERRQYTVESRSAGWIETLHLRAEGDPVRKGQRLATLYAPELLAAQREVELAEARGDARLAAASRERLRLLAGGADAVLRAPSDGVVTALMAREGAQLAPGMPLMQIADLSTVWVTLEIPEAQAGALAVGQPAEARLPALPGEVFQGRVDYLYPTLDPDTRSLRARLVFDNADAQLRPGMYAQVALSLPDTGPQLRIPSEALIRTGRRTMVMLAEAEGRYRPVAVVPGEDLGDETVILDGLQEGQRVVVSGQFLIDSEASLLGAYRRLSPLDQTAPGSMQNDHAMDHGDMNHEGMDHDGMEHGGTPAERRPHEGMHHESMEHGGVPAESRSQEGGNHPGMEHGGTPAERRPHEGMQHEGMEHGGTPAEHRPHGGMQHEGMEHGGAPAAPRPSPSARGPNADAAEARR